MHIFQKALCSWTALKHQKIHTQQKYYKSCKNIKQHAHCNYTHDCIMSQDCIHIGTEGAASFIEIPAKIKNLKKTEWLESRLWLFSVLTFKSKIVIQVTTWVDNSTYSFHAPVSPSKSVPGMHSLSLTKWNNFNAKNIEQVQRCSDNFYAVLVGEIGTRHRLYACASVLLRMFVIRLHLFHPASYRLEVGKHSLRLKVIPRDSVNYDVFVCRNEPMSGHSQHWHDVRQQHTSFKPTSNVAQWHVHDEDFLTWLNRL